MFNPLTRVKDIIDLLRNPPGKAVAAMEITDANKQILRDYEIPEKYLRTGDFYLEFETTSTVCPRKEFFKHYAFDGTVRENELTLVRTIKPL